VLFQIAVFGALDHLAALGGLMISTRG